MGAEHSSPAMRFEVALGLRLVREAAETGAQSPRKAAGFRFPEEEKVPPPPARGPASSTRKAAGFDVADSSHEESAEEEVAVLAPFSTAHRMPPTAPPAAPAAPATPAAPAAPAHQLDDEMTDVASTVESTAWLSEAPTDFADVADVQSLKQFSTALTRRPARAPLAASAASSMRTVCSASALAVEEANKADEADEAQEAQEVEEAQEAAEAEDTAAQWEGVAEAEPVLSQGEWQRQEALMLLAAKDMAAEEESRDAPALCPSEAPSAAAAAPPVRPALPPPPPPIVGAVPPEAAVVPLMPLRVCVPTAERLALAAAVLFLSGALLGGGGVDSVLSAMLVVTGGMQWLISALWLRHAGWRHPFFIGWLVVLGLHEALDQVSDATASLLEVAAAVRHDSRCEAVPGP